MSLLELLPAVQALSQNEKTQLAQFLKEELAKAQILAQFKDGQEYPIYTPEFAPDAAVVLAKLLEEARQQS